MSLPAIRHAVAALVVLVACGGPQNLNPLDRPDESVGPENSAPVAAAALHDSLLGQQLFAGTPILLDGAASHDPDGDPLTYVWTVPEFPPSSAHLLSGADSALLHITDVVAGPYRAVLTVRDDGGLSADASVTFEVTPVVEICQGAVTALPYGASDLDGDVTLANADVVRAAAAVSDGMVDFRVQFCDVPFPDTATHHFSICIDLDGDPQTGDACGQSGADRSFMVQKTPQQRLVMTPSLDLCNVVTFDETSRTMRLLLPVSQVNNVTDFGFSVLSVFGGSIGNNESVPDAPSFSSPNGYLVNEAEPLPAFVGVSICAVRP